jgi:hypothetical protein
MRRNLDRAVTARDVGDVGGRQAVAGEGEGGLDGRLGDASP